MRLVNDIGLWMPPSTIWSLSSFCWACGPNCQQWHMHWVPKKGTSMTHLCKADTHIPSGWGIRRQLWEPEQWGYEHCWTCFWDFTTPQFCDEGGLCRAIRHEWQQLSCRHLVAFQLCRGSSAFSRGLTMSTWAGSNILGCCSHFFVCKAQGYWALLPFQNQLEPWPGLHVVSPSNIGDI